MRTELKRKTYYKLIFATSIQVGQTLRILQWREERVSGCRSWDKGYPAGYYPVWGYVEDVRRFGSSVIVCYSRPSVLVPGKRQRGETLYYPKQYACLVLATGERQPDSLT